MIYNHMQSIINQISATSQKVSLSMDLVKGSHSSNNCTDEVRRKIDLKLLSKSDHALVAMKMKVIAAIKSVLENVTEIEAPDPIVSTQQNFDSLLIPSGHYCRRPTDVYYATDNAMLRTHLTAHVVDTVKSGLDSYVMSGPVFRRLEEDDEHSELCHQVTPMMNN
jgi:phenylalanyl-tRNA synthetase alpha subunit